MSNPEIITIAVGAVAFLVGVLFTYAVQQSRISQVRREQEAHRSDLHERELEAQEAKQAMEAVQQSLSEERQRSQGLAASLEEEKALNQSLRLQEATNTEALSGAKRELETQQTSARQQQASMQSQLDDVRDAMKQEQSAKEALGEEVSRLKATLSDRESRLESRAKTLQDTQERLEAAETELRQYQQNAQQRIDDAQKVLAQTREALGSAQSDLKSTTANLQEAKNQRDEAQKHLHEVQEAHHALKKAHGELMTRTEEKEAQFARQLQWMEESKQQLKVEFENLANELLDQKGKAFSSLSERNLQELLKPFQSEIKGFREKVETLHTQETEQRASLRTELKHLQQLNRDITDQAAQLTEALKGQKKVQGNWGELMLENVLDSAGLRPGEDYQRERSFDTEDGKRRPDAVIYLPQGRHMVIDAKTSLVAYMDFVNAEDDLSRQQALANHARAVSSRIEELADKHYYDLPGLNSPEVVVMFIPMESAYIEALRHDSTLYQRAIERNVLVATPTTLLTSLNIVSQLWRFENQSRHSAELARKAERFYNKLATFLESMQDVGKKLDGARTSYDKALGQLVNGKGNLIKQATEFQELGVAVKKELPAEIVERAKLEVGTASAETGRLPQLDTEVQESQ
ncbi:DNA recombination protein RmuC [uncultured Halomonas sp.]|uniref:DNA recombination protein RmuC n=1 Tax=uncultured Halomonas sp. TaxID=173971 RepID=UPI002624EC66|nr:DNA recombination protein RmuC [uncultured Halomonas sp.]